MTDIVLTSTGMRAKKISNIHFIFPENFDNSRKSEGKTLEDQSADSALRIYNPFNLCLCVRHAHVGKSGPQARLQVL